MSLIVAVIGIVLTLIVIAVAISSTDVLGDVEDETKDTVEEGKKSITAQAVRAKCEKECIKVCASSSKSEPDVEITLEGEKISCSNNDYTENSECECKSLSG